MPGQPSDRIRMPVLHKAVTVRRKITIASSMTKKKLDLIPLVIFLVSVLLLFYEVIINRVGLQLPHYIGFILLAASLFLFFRNHKMGVLSIGLTCILGLIGLVSFSPAISVFSMEANISEYSSLTLFRFQPIFIVWLILHLFLSGRYYLGIANKKYWDNINSEKTYKEFE